MDVEHSNDLGNKISSFSLNLLKQLSTSSNLVYSPTSIYIALAMAALGSHGESLQQFQTLLQFSNANDLARLTSDLQTNLLATGNGITTSIANKVFTGLKEIKSEYVQLLTQHFKSAFENVDFASSYEQIRLQINQWVSTTTNNKIKDLLPQGTLDNLTRMVLVNAIYFKGAWSTKFDNKKTHKAHFHLEYKQAGKKINVDMMNQEMKYDYFQTGDYQYISIPYKDQSYRMEIVLPTKSLVNFEKQTKGNIFSQGRHNKQNMKVNLSLPRFKIEGQSINLNAVLGALGLIHPFTNGADFSLMDPDNSIKISSVFHKAVIEVNEEGAEAAAATAVTMVLKCIEPKAEMTCNRPFLFAITHEPTETELFVGKVTNPFIV